MRLENFIGKATVAIDSAGRTNFPKELRKLMPEEAEGQVIVTVGEKQTLVLYPLPAWNAFMADLAKRPRNPVTTKFMTRITSMAKLSALDGQNRITLTPEQMEYAGINSEVTFVGDNQRVRLWAPARYIEEIATVTPDEDALFEQMY